MKIIELLNSGANVSVNVSVSDLKEFMEEIVVEASSKTVEQKEEKYLTIGEACEVLHVSKNSLWRWGKIGYLCPVKIGRQSFYRESDINNLRSGKGA